MDAWKTLNNTVNDIVYYPQNAENYWLSYHKRNNRNIRKHMLSHSMLLAVAIRKRDGREILTQGWLGSSVIPSHVRDFILEKI